MKELVAFWSGFTLGGLTLAYLGFIAGMIVADWRRGLPRRIANWTETHWGIARTCDTCGSDSPHANNCPERPA